MKGVMAGKDGHEVIPIIENCEELPSEWLIAEYRQAAQFWPGLLVANVSSSSMKSRLRGIPTVRESASDYTQGRDAIVLDPAADLELSTSDFERARFVVVGGILGSRFFTGKTGKLVSSRFGKERNLFRNAGKIQLPVDVAVFVARAVMLGSSLSGIELTSEVEIRWDEGHSTVLPYGYPIIDGKLILTPGLIDILRRGL